MNMSDIKSEIFDLRKKAALYLQAGDAEEFNRIQITIGELQQKHGAVTGVGKEKDERTA